MANTGAVPSNAMRTPAAVALASATGMIERGAKFEQQQFDGEQHGRYGAAEGRGHARRGTGGEERLPFGGAWC